MSQMSIADAAAAMSGKAQWRTRMYDHPIFENLRTHKDAEKALDESDEGQGACVLRPSNQGDSLTLTWCHIGANPAEGGYPAKAMYYHIKVREVERADVPGGLGFEVDGEAFEDLDEIAARFVGELNRHTDAVLSHRKFHAGEKAVMEASLHAQKQDNPKQIPYALSLDERLPGYLSLIHI